MKRLNTLAQAEEFIFNILGKNVHLATPLGLGKPNQLLNLIYDRAEKNPEIKLKIFTALSLDFADPTSDIEQRFLGEFYRRQFGENYPHLKYVRAAQKNQLPGNIVLHEFYFQAGSLLKSSQAQRNYISLNYTHVAPAILQHDINVIVQLISKSPTGTYSLSCNPDLTLDVKDLYNKHNRKVLMIGVVHPDLPYMGGDAEVDENFFDVVVESPEVQHKLFALPKTSEDEMEHMIGLYASQLIKDGGTLQIGIGSLSDAVVHSTIIRHEQNALYNKMLQEISGDEKSSEHYFREPLHVGLYGTSEMLMDGFMHLRKAGILKREIYDHEESAKRYLHGAFFLGSRDFYEWLRNLKGSDHHGLSMTRVSKVNDLYDPHEMAIRRQRKSARFFNTCMSVTLLGGAASDTLENGNVISGVGGQYNFVAMAHELEDAQSILMLRSVREKNGKRHSNIVIGQGQLTISRHLRDVVITEYGIAFLRGESDENVIKKLIEIADSEFQSELVAWAKKNHKISENYEVPEHARNNRPEKVKIFIKKYQDNGLFPLYPFGSDFTQEEIVLGKALLKLKDSSALQKLGFVFSGIFKDKNKYRRELERMNLFSPKSVKEQIYQKIILGSL